MIEISEAQARNLMAGKPMMQGLTGRDVVNAIPGSAKRPEIRPEGAEDAEKARIALLERKLGTALSLLGMSSADQIPDDMSSGQVIMEDLEKGQDLKEPASMEGQGPTVEDNPDIVMLEQVRIDGKGKAKVEAYCLEKFGVDLDRRFKLDKMVDTAIGLIKDKISKEATEATKGIPKPNMPPEF